MTNREIRRMEARRQGKSSRYAWKNYSRIATGDELLTDENEISVWTSTLVGYQAITGYMQIQLQEALIMHSANVSGDLMRAWFGPGQVPAAAYKEIRAKISGRNYRDIYKFESLEDAINRLNTAYTNEEYKNLWTLVGDPEIDPFDVIKEIYHHSAGMRDLTAMHVDWLKKKKRSEQKDTKLKTSTQELPIEVTEQEVNKLKVGQAVNSPIVNYDPFLPEIELFWVTKPWSIDPNDRELIDTSSKPKAVEEIKRLTRGYGSIKPISIANALEFYTRQDVIQKALNARLKYVPDYIKDWARVKRGRDRIALQEINDIEERRQIIFFLEGRDEIYRPLKRL